MGSSQSLAADAGVQSILDALDKSLDKSLERFDCITARMSASDYNSIARTQNSLLSGPNDAIMPLRSPSTNSAIPGFPATPYAIDQLQAAAADTLLTALEQSTDGSIAAKRERIGIAIGLAVKRNVSEAP
ncbi:hypothetical protein KC318_g1083 [Hortaea werneckii]|nr:hypothetical protein KC334_g1099 [Hortaea werneckii]KAI7025241.1 hypothetical protein KC355_g1108 [Hortaea werneckii]KAI7203789.1 hypothetical protein KC324_g1083 [Hortaea werneckii]KAI7594908.1 hypothetical protein KC316_g861 [Hortaea werneckii]KAI7675252.1 hypothetical protein KC318_g1083 [Hortaea werneckii]